MILLAYCQLESIIALRLLINYMEFQIASETLNIFNDNKSSHEILKCTLQ